LTLLNGIQVVQTGAKNIEIAVMTESGLTVHHSIDGWHTLITQNLALEQVEQVVAEIEKEKEAEAEKKKKNLGSSDAAAASSS
jgi:hypothetical protein